MSLNKMTKTRFRHYGCYLLIALWGAVCWAFFQFCYPYHFFYQEQNQLFVLTRDEWYRYVSEGSGWLARWVGDFLTQFYYYLYVGAILLTICLLALGDVVRRALQGLGMRRGWAMALGIGVMTAEAWRHLWYAYPLSSTMTLLGYALAVWFASLLPTRRRWVRGVVLLIVLAFAYCLFGLPEKGKFRMPEMEMERYLAIDNEYYFGHDERVVELAKKDGGKLNISSFYYNLSNARLGRLPDGLLALQPVELGTLWQIGPETPVSIIRVMNELYYELGDMTYAERAAMMGNVFTRHNRNVRMVKRLAECNLVSGDSAAAEKYLRLLDHTLTYSQWAKLARKNPVYARKSAYVNRADTLRLGDDARTILTELLDSNPNNDIALDYLLCHELVQRNVAMFKMYYDKYCMARQKPRIRPLYQQALLAWLASNHATEEEMLRYIQDESQLRNFNAYNAVRGTAAAAKWRETYWYYFDKRSPTDPPQPFL